MSRILIAGCGEIGATLGVRLGADGHEVWGLRRRTVELPGSIRPLRADLTVSQTLEALPAALDSVVYIAAADNYSDQAYEAAYVQGPANLMQALTATGQNVRRIIFVSSTGVYAQCDGEWVDERSATHPADFSGRRLLEGERLVLDGSNRALVVRFGGIYGPGRDRLLNRVRDRRPCRDRPPQYTNRIHSEDCAGVLHHLLSLESTDQIYLGVDNEPAAQCAVMDWLAKQMGVPMPPRSRTTDATGERRRSNKRCRNARLLSTGYRFLYPSYREGYGKILADRKTVK